MTWTLSNRASPGGRELADRHYNRQQVGAQQFVPPGTCLVLLQPGALWVTSWPKAEFVQHAWAGSLVNSTFRREPDCPYLASDLIRQAVAASLWKWPKCPVGMVTFIDRDKVRHKRDPGRCYRKAGFHVIGETKGGLLAYYLEREDFPDPEPPMGVQGELLLPAEASSAGDA